jgi:hypothetical protein
VAAIVQDEKSVVVFNLISDFFILMDVMNCGAFIQKHGAQDLDTGVFIELCHWWRTIWVHSIWVDEITPVV